MRAKRNQERRKHFSAFFSFPHAFNVKKREKDGFPVGWKRYYAKGLQQNLIARQQPQCF
jgi:hypothetical protein